MSAEPIGVAAATVADQTIIEDPNQWEEPADYALRQQLGLRPVYYPNPESDPTAHHPDKRPCPSWCSMGQNGFQHGIDPRRPFSAEHMSEPIDTVASCWPASPSPEFGRGVIPATWETHLQGRGSAEDPIISIALRYVDSNDALHFGEKMRLTLDDAADLVTVLQHFIAQADAAQMEAEADR